jgi:hypothetical protein
MNGAEKVLLTQATPRREYCVSGQHRLDSPMYFKSGLEDVKAQDVYNNLHDQLRLDNPIELQAEEDATDEEDAEYYASTSNEEVETVVAEEETIGEEEEREAEEKLDKEYFSEEEYDRMVKTYLATLDKYKEEPEPEVKPCSEPSVGRYDACGCHMLDFVKAKSTGKDYKAENEEREKKVDEWSKTEYKATQLVVRYGHSRLIPMYSYVGVEKATKPWAPPTFGRDQHQLNHLLSGPVMSMVVPAPDTKWKYSEGANLNISNRSDALHFITEHDAIGPWQGNCTPIAWDEQGHAIKWQHIELAQNQSLSLHMLVCRSQSLASNGEGCYLRRAQDAWTIHEVIAENLPKYRASLERSKHLWNPATVRSTWSAEYAAYYECFDKWSKARNNRGSLEDRTSILDYETYYRADPLGNVIGELPTGDRIVWWGTKEERTVPDVTFVGPTDAGASTALLSEPPQDFIPSKQDLEFLTENERKFLYLLGERVTLRQTVGRAHRGLSCMHAKVSLIEKTKGEGNWNFEIYSGDERARFSLGIIKKQGLTATKAFEHCTQMANREGLSDEQEWTWRLRASVCKLIAPRIAEKDYCPTDKEDALARHYDSLYKKDEEGETEERFDTDKQEHIEAHPVTFAMGKYYTLNKKRYVPKLKRKCNCATCKETVAICKSRFFLRYRPEPVFIEAMANPKPHWVPRWEDLSNSAALYGQTGEWDFSTDLVCEYGITRVKRALCLIPAGLSPEAQLKFVTHALPYVKLTSAEHESDRMFWDNYLAETKLRIEADNKSYDDTPVHKAEEKLSPKEVRKEMRKAIRERTTTEQKAARTQLLSTETSKERSKRQKLEGKIALAVWNRNAPKMKATGLGRKQKVTP